MKPQTPLQTNEVTVEIFADVICPWCYIGKRRLDAALATRPHIVPRIIWRTFLLNPMMPLEGMSRTAYLAAKFGHSAAAVYGRIAAAGMDSGIEFNFDKIQLTPNSRMAHKMLISAGADTNALSEAFYKAYFIDGLDIGDSAVLIDIAAGIGRADLASALSDETIQSQMENDIASAHQFNLDGVPFYVFGGAFSIAGAHTTEHLTLAIDAAAG